jgi:hypothetical protein
MARSKLPSGRKRLTREPAPVRHQQVILHVGLGIVQAITGKAGVRIADRRDRNRIEREEGKAGFEAGHETGLIAAFDDPADTLRHRPAFARIAGERKSMQKLFH